MGILADWRERRRVRKLFKKYVSLPPKVTPELPTIKHFQFVIVNLDDSDVQEFGERLGSVLSELCEQNAVVQGITPPIILATLGGQFPEYDRPELRVGLVDALIAKHPGVRVAHGECESVWGIFGSKRSYWGPLIPEMTETLKKLLTVPFGNAFEVAFSAKSGASSELVG